MKKLVALVAGLVLVVGLLSGFGVRAKESRWAYVENQTSDTLTLTFEQRREGYKTKNQMPIYSGQVLRMDPTTIEGEVCAWRLHELKPGEKLACRSLQPGDRWVIY